jgi:hypothetical protein
MTDVRNLGGPGQAVFDTAQRLQKSGLIDEAQFKELTNDKVGPQDVAIGNEALNRLQANTPDAMKLLTAIPKMNNDIITMQRQALQKTMEQGKPEPRGAAADTSRDASLRQFIDMIAGTAPTSNLREIGR